MKTWTDASDSLGDLYRRLLETDAQPARAGFSSPTPKDLLGRIQSNNNHLALNVAPLHIGR
jgi:hypothetical protein